MRSGASKAKRWISLGLLLVMALSLALPAFALPSLWYKKIYVTKNPTKTTYQVGESFDTAGLKISGDVYGSDGKYVQTNPLGLSSLSVSPATFTKTGKQKVTLGLYCMGKDGYDWLYTSVSVTVEKPGDGPIEWYTDIFVASQPNKTIYTVGESFKTSGLSISGHVYNALDGKKHTVTKLSQKNMKISPATFTKSGKQNVKLSLYLLTKNGEYKWFSTSVQVLVEKGAVKITKHPTGETVYEGGSCSFIARADNADSRHWYFTKNGVVVDSADASAYFPGLKVSGTSKEHLKLNNIPVSMNGWTAYCVFYGKSGSVNSNRAGIQVLTNDPTPPPTEEPPAVITPKPIVTTPQPTEEPAFTPEPAITEAPATEIPATEAPAPTEKATAVPTEAPTPTPVPTPAPTATPAPTPEPVYAEGIHCTVNGQEKALIQGDTLLTCVAEEIDGYVFDHWDVNGEADYDFGSTATFIASEAAVIRACYHERKVVRAVNCYLQLLTKKNNASGTKYTEFDFEDPYYNPVTKEHHGGGTIDFYVTAVIPRKGEVDYWLINGVKYQFCENNVTKFRVLELDEATTIEVVFKGADPSYGQSHDSRFEELVYQAPHLMRCINCWGQFMNNSGSPSGKTYMEFDFDQPYTNPVTMKKLPGGLLDIFIATKIPRGCTVDTWYINNVKYQFPQTVSRFRVMGLDEATTYEVRFKGLGSATTPPSKYPGRDPSDWGWH